MSILLSANHSPRSRDGAGEWNLVPMEESTPDPPPAHETLT